MAPAGYASGDKPRRSRYNSASFILERHGRQHLMSTTQPPKSGLSYRDAGVDIDAGGRLGDRIKPIAARTRRPGVLAGIGGFGALFEIPPGYRQPVLVSGTDGVGTKQKLAMQLGRHDTIGNDLASSGPHSNGYSLVRKIIDVSGADLSQAFHGRTLGETLLEPTRIYVKALLALLNEMPEHALAHITGGGITENLPRVLPDDTGAVVHTGSWPRPPVFEWLQQQGNVATDEMYRTFNCGIGMIVCVPAAVAEQALNLLRTQGETAWRIGEIVTRGADDGQVTLLAS